MLENHKSISLSFIFLKEKKKKTACPVGSLAWASDPVGHPKKRGAIFSMSAIFSMNKAKCMQRDHVTVQVN